MAKRTTKTPNFNSTQKGINEISKIGLEKVPAKGFFAKMGANARNAKLKYKKMAAIKDLAKSSQKVTTRAIDAAKDVANSFIATETVKDLSNKNGNRSSLVTWTKNMYGNPNPEEGQTGQTQEGSTSNLYNELGGI